MLHEHEENQIQGHGDQLHPMRESHAAEQPDGRLDRLPQLRVFLLFVFARRGGSGDHG